MDWQQIFIDSGLLEAILGFVAIVVGAYLKIALAKWAKATETSEALKVADALVKAALQKYGDKAKTKMKEYAMDGMAKILPKLPPETADAYIEGAVLKLKEQLQ